jgi:hypothetical protein
VRRETAKSAGSVANAGVGTPNRQMAREVEIGRYDNPLWRYQRYHIGFVFCIPPSDLVETFGIAALPVTISTNRIPGSPIRNPPAAGATRARGIKLQHTEGSLFHGLC